ncbi:hypothetical protein RND59_05185 [Vibrio ruber]|uniref:hypothetical protein n=1 Tax=Vibrio ruber TaxID=184755 RepID=UPI002892A13D|nr:hypothetical protein [Vibrio ruber]WNJ96493.1 hypothetical protein RND59_05185 [Vibrio ruber]
MINILIPLAGKNTFETNSNNMFPKILSDVGGELLIERACKPFINLHFPKKLVVAVPKNEADKYKLNSVIPLLADEVELCCINGDTQGAACSALLAIEHLDLNSPLIISSFEQVLDFDLNCYIEYFQQENVDAGVLTFEAIHPKWSYARVDSDNNITQTAEKQPISKNAIAGFYYFKSANLFIESAKEMIRKDVKTNNLFYIAPVINEIILNGGLVKSQPIDNSRYFHINDEHALSSYEEKVMDEKKNRTGAIKSQTIDYIKFFNNCDIGGIATLLSNDFSLSDPVVNINGKDDAIEYIVNIFDSHKNIKFKSLSVMVSNEYESIIEFELILGNNHFRGVDLISWDKSNKMISMRAYLYEADHG